MQQKVLSPFRKQVRLTMSLHFLLVLVLKVNAKCNSRLEELYWLQSLLKNVDGLSMLGVGSIIVRLLKEVDFVLMQTFLFAYILPLPV